MLQDSQKLTVIACYFAIVLLTSLLRAIWSRQEPHSHQGQVEQKMGNLACEQVLMFEPGVQVPKPQEETRLHANTKRH